MRRMIYYFWEAIVLFLVMAALAFYFLGLPEVLK